MIDRQQELEIIEKISNEPFITAASFAREYGVSDKSISRVFQRNGIHCFIAAKQTKLSDEQKINRIAFCEQTLENWNDFGFNKVVFSDEKTFSTDVDWKAIVYRPRGCRYYPEFVKETTLSGRITAGYWGAISIEGPATDLVPIKGNLNSEKYIRIIRNHVRPAMTRFGDRVFMQDNCPVHKSERVMNYLSNQTFETMAWPPCSPDLNPIENVWGYITRDWPQMERRTNEALDAIVQERWNNLRQDPGKKYI